MFFKKSSYSLRKSSNILHTSYNWYKKRGNRLSEDSKVKLKEQLLDLDKAVQEGNREQASVLAKKLESFGEVHFKRSFFDYTKEFVIAIVLALAVATVVRQMWFELYEIPTGSMRPTFREQDHLTVSKLAFGLNVPLKTEHFYFDPSLVQRTGVFIFSGVNIPFIDQDTTYFWVFPYKKRYIKRLIGKPGDSLYFYGGKIYGVDRDGNEITELLANPYLQGLEHIPFLTFEGIVSAPTRNQFIFKQFYKPLGRLNVQPDGSFKGEIFNGKNWIKDNQSVEEQPHQQIETYSDFAGIRNFAMARLLTRKQLEEIGDVDVKNLDEGVLYLELRHSPNLSKARFQQDKRGLILTLSSSVSVIPLQQKHLNAIMDSMYTARFGVANGRAYRYSLEENSGPNTSSPYIKNVEDGMYEFYHGKAFKVGWGGILSELPSDHPLYRKDPAHIQKLFNLGIDFDTAYSPRPSQATFPQRYAYFRDGDLFLLGSPILKKGEDVLDNFLKSEQQRTEESSSGSQPYIAFKDYGAPLLEDGGLDKDFIKAFGVQVPDKHYMALGDNHAMSSDSRIFGFVPEANIQGAPSLIIWPPGDRIGKPQQPPYQLINTPRLIVWGLVALALAIWYFIHRRKMQKPIVL